MAVPAALRTAAALVSVEAIVESAVVWQREELTPGLRVMLIMFLALKWVFSIGILRLRSGAALGVFLLEGTSVVAAFGATDAPTGARLALAGTAVLAIVLVASALHAFPEAPLPLIRGPMDPATPKPKLPRTAADRRYAIFVAVCLVAAAVTMYFAIHLTNTDQDEPATVSAAPKVVEHLIPPAGSQELRQSELGIDLAPGYQAELLVNGISIPRKQLREVPEQNQVFFTPGKGKVIEELDAGQVCVTAIVWSSAVGRGPKDQPFQWCFGVA